MGFGQKWVNRSGTRLYFSWRSMRQRCLNPKNKVFKNYGGRGITVCKAWLNYDNFFKWAIKNGYKNNLTLERLNVDKGYKPSNCKWILLKHQARNTQRTVRLTFNGVTKALSEWCEFLEVDYAKVAKRHHKYGATTFEELFHSGRLFSLRKSKEKHKCLECKTTKSSKWRVSLCHNCYHRKLRLKNKLHESRKRLES